MHRRTLLASAGPLALLGRAARAQAPGVTATEIRIGQTQAYSGPASAYGAIGRGLAAFFAQVNDRGGVAGRRIRFISVDDGYLPPRTVEQTRRLVELEGVSFMLNSLGTPSNTAVQRYLNQRRVPQLFVSSGADKWANPRDFPWTIGWHPSYRTSARIYARHILQNRRDGRIAVLYQNDDFGKDYLAGLRDVLGDRYDRMVVKALSYEAADPTIDSQAVTLHGSGADVLVTAATPKFAAQLIRRIYDLGWTPLHLMTDVSLSVAAVINPAGPERAVGMIAAAYLKEATDPALQDDPGMIEWRAFMKDYMPEADVTDSYYPYAYGVGVTTLQVLKQCDGDFSRETIMRQATNLRDLQVATLLPGLSVNTSPTNYRPIQRMQLQRWSGTRWERFGDVIEAGGS